MLQGHFTSVLGARCRDELLAEVREAVFPSFGNQETYTCTGRGEKSEVQAPFGYRTGIALAAHLSRDLHFCIGVDRDQALPACRAEVTRVAAELQLFAAHAQEAALRVLLPESARPEIPDLTRRELEGLRWTMEGTTAWELGRILGISEQTASRHLNNATHKLDCVNKHHAVVKALRLGLIR